MDICMFKERLNSIAHSIEEKDPICELIMNLCPPVNKPTLEDGDFQFAVDQLLAIKEELAVEDRNVKQIQAELKNLSDEVASLEKKYSKSLQQKKALEEENAQLELETKFSKMDISRLENKVTKYKSLKLLTGVHWDYTDMSSGRIKGYICNKATDMVHPFTIDSNTDGQQLWDEISKCCHANWSHDKKDKENKKPN